MARSTEGAALGPVAIDGVVNADGAVIVNARETVGALRSLAERDPDFTADEGNWLERLYDEMPEDRALAVAVEGPLIEPKIEAALRALLRELYDAWWIKAGNAYRELTLLLGRPESVERSGGPPQ